MNFPRSLLFHFYNLFFCTFTFHVTFTVFGVLLLFNSTFSSPHRLHCPDQSFFFPLSLSSILTVPFRPLKIYSSFSSSKKKKKTYRLILCFLLGALKFLESGSTKKKYNKKEQLEVSCNIS